MKKARSADQAAEPPREEHLDDDLARLHRETALWQEFLVVHKRLVEQLAEQMVRDHRIPLEWFDILVHLADTPDRRLRQVTLRDRLLLSESGVSRRLDRMAQAGLITRSAADEDRRGVEIALTEQGRQALTAATTTHLQLVDTLFTGRLTATDRVALHRVLTKLLATQYE